MTFTARLATALLMLAGVAAPAVAAPTSPDPGFGGDGSVTLHSDAHDEDLADLLVLDDGRVMVLTLTDANPGIELWRLRADGSPDPAYGGGDGVHAFGGAENYEDAHLAVDPDSGKAYVSVFVDGPPFPTIVFRLTASGSPDLSFGAGAGQVTFLQRIVNDLTTAPGGKLVMVGSTFDTDTANVWRLTDAGAPDPGFGAGGTVVLSADPVDDADAVVRLPDGRLVIAGSHFNATAANLPVYRVTGNGALDPSFSGDGRTVIDPSSPGVTTSTVWSPDVVVRPDGRLVVVAGLNQNNGAFINSLLVAGLKASGVPDGRFGTRVRTDLTATDVSAVLQRDGMLVVGVKAPPNPSTTGGILRLTPTGADDSTWDNDGLLPVPSTPSNVRLGLAPTGRLIAGLRPNGTSDTQLLAYKGTRTPRCRGKLATQFGTRSADTIKGTSARDVLVGRAGRDKIKGRGGKDLICGNAGGDRLFGGNGKDKIYGQDGNDLLVGNQGNDVLQGGPGKNTVRP